MFAKPEIELYCTTFFYMENEFGVRYLDNGDGTTLVSVDDGIEFCR